MVPLLPSPSRVKRVSELIGDWRSSRQERQTATRTAHIASDPPQNSNFFSPSITTPSSHRGSTTDPETCPGRVSHPPQNGSQAGDVGVCEANPNHAGVCRDPACNTTGRTVPPSIGWSIGNPFADAVPRTASSSVSPMARNRNPLPPSRRSSPLHPNPRHRNQPRM